MRALATYGHGDFVSFGYGYGRTRVALRALVHRAPDLIEYQARDGDEFFCITEAGRAAVSAGERD
jgi:hypothetical protein